MTGMGALLDIDVYGALIAWPEEKWEHVGAGKKMERQAGSDRGSRGIPEPVQTSFVLLSNSPNFCQCIKDGRL